MLKTLRRPDLFQQETAQKCGNSGRVPAVSRRIRAVPMKRLALLLIAVALLSPAASNAKLPTYPVCKLFPGSASKCHFVAPVTGSLFYAIQGAIAVDLPH